MEQVEPADELIKFIQDTYEINRGGSGTQFVGKSVGPNISLMKIPVRTPSMFLRIGLLDVTEAL